MLISEGGCQLLTTGFSIIFYTMYTVLIIRSVESGKHVLFLVKLIYEI